MRELAFPDEPEMHTRRIAIGESHYKYYSHSGRDEVVDYRRLAEVWLSEYPEDHLRDFLRQFRGKDAQNHASAFFELFLHERLRVLCDELKVERVIPDSGKQADFLLHYSDGSALAVEALSMETVESIDENVNLVNEWVRQLTSRDFKIWFGASDGHLSATPRKRPVQNWGRRVLSKYNWAQADEAVRATGQRLIPVEPLQLGDWVVQANLWVNLPEERTERECLTIHAGRTAGSNEVPTILRQRITKKIKAKKSQRGSTPFILAVNVNDHMFDPGEEELEILHGFKPHVRFTTVRNDGKPAELNLRGVFAPDGTEGVWSTSDNKPQYSRCSAIWFFHHVGVVCPRGTRQKLYLNPFVSHDFRTLALHHFATADVGLPD